MASADMQEMYTGYDNSGYMGAYPQWQEQWNWGTDGSDYTTGEQFCGNVAFFVQFPGMVGGVPVANTNATQESAETSQTTVATGKFPEMEAKMAKLQAENQRLLHLYETERQMRQIEIRAKQQILEMYAVPRSEVEQLVRRFQEESPTTTMHYGENATPFVTVSNASTRAGSPGTTGTSATSLETLLQDLYKKLYEPDHDRDNAEENGARDAGSGNSSVVKTEEEEHEELKQQLSQLERMVEMEVDERARASVLRMSPHQGKIALRKVEDIIQEQGGFCHNLSSMVQSVCRKMGYINFTRQ